MLIRMDHVRPSLGPIPQPRQPRTLIRVPKMAPMLWWPSAVPSCRAHSRGTPARPRRQAGRPGACGDSTTCAKRDVAAIYPAMSRTTTKPDVLRHRGRGPSFRDRLQRWKLRPRLDPARAGSVPALLTPTPGKGQSHAGIAVIHLLPGDGVATSRGWVVPAVHFETRASACCALTAYAPIRASSR